MVRLRPLSIGTLLLTVVLSPSAWAVINMDFKAGTQTLQHPWTLEQTTRPRYEISVAGTPYDNDQLEIALAFGGCSVGHATDTVTAYDSYGMLQDTYEDHFRMYDLRLGLRIYPISPEDRGCIHPYVGAGLGYYWMVNDWDYTHLETIDSPYSEYWEEDNGHTNISKGLFSFVTAGVDIPLSDQVALLFEFQHDFQKTDGGVDYGDSIYMLGLRMTW